jgi:ubiquinone/menaquinone biosynthesis C-methylase UbiE
MAIKQFHRKADQEYWDTLWKGSSFNKSIIYARKYKQYKLMKKYTNPTMPVLEGGCGLSKWVYVMHKDGYNITGVDFAENTVDRVNLLSPELNVVKGDVFNLNFPDGYFGTYYSWGVVEHFEEGPDDILKEANRVIAKNGTLMISVPFLNPARKKAYSELVRIGEGEYFYQYMFEEEEFIQKLNNAGFEVEAVYKLNWIIGYKDLKNLNHKIRLREYKDVEFDSEKYNNKRKLRSVLKKYLTLIIIKISDLGFLSKKFGHMVLFVAKKS